MGQKGRNLWVSLFTNFIWCNIYNSTILPTSGAKQAIEGDTA